MSNNLGQIFYDGKLINLEGAEEIELRSIFHEFQEIQAKQKDNIDNCLQKMIMVS